MPYNVIQGTWEHLRGVEDTFEAIYHYFGPFRPNAILLCVRSKYPRNAQNHHFRPKIMIFSKWVYVLVWPIYGRKYAFGMSQTHFKRFYDIWGTSGAFFKNPKKIDFLTHFLQFTHIYEAIRTNFTTRLCTALTRRLSTELERPLEIF